MRFIKQKSGLPFSHCILTIGHLGLVSLDEPHAEREVVARRPAAEVNAQGGEYGNALQAASRGGL